MASLSTGLLIGPRGLQADEEGMESEQVIEVLRRMVAYPLHAAMLITAFP